LRCPSVSVVVPAAPVLFSPTIAYRSFGIQPNLATRSGNAMRVAGKLSCKGESRAQNFGIPHENAIENECKPLI
jgi:hypothetical protein